MNEKNGADIFEDWVSNVYPKVLHQIREEGKLARIEGKTKQDNPHRVKIYKATWEAGYESKN